MGAGLEFRKTAIEKTVGLRSGNVDALYIRSAPGHQLRPDTPEQNVSLCSEGLREGPLQIAKITNNTKRSEPEVAVRS